MATRTARKTAAKKTAAKNNAEVQAVVEASKHDPKVIEIPDSITVALETFTPEQAEKALTVNDVNRNLRPGSVTKYQSDMENDFWNLPDSCIVFDENGRLINGQHRFTAQVRGEYTCTYVVMRGVPVDYQSTMDNTATRSPADALHLAGITQAPLIASIASIAVKLERGSFTTRMNVTTSSDVLDIVHRHPELLISGEAALRSYGGMTRVYPRVIGATHWWISQWNNMAEADAFMARLATLYGEPPGSPVLALNRRINEMKRNNMRVHWRDMFFMVMKAWNYDVEGTKIQRIQHQAKGGYKILEPLVRTDSQLGDEDEPYVEGMVDVDDGTENDGDGDIVEE